MEVLDTKPSEGGASVSDAVAETKRRLFYPGDVVAKRISNFWEISHELRYGAVMKPSSIAGLQNVNNDGKEKSFHVMWDGYTK
jgi:hypothetical protein